MSTEPRAPDAQVPAAENRRALVARIASAIARELAPGDLADLRRLRPEEPGSPAFWRLCATFPAGILPDGPGRDDGERRWAAVLAALAHLRGLHDPRRPLGRALAEVGLSELRFLRLLRAREAGLYDAVRSVAHYLAQRGEPADHTHLADLILDQDGDRAEAIRRRIARHFYAAERETK